MKRLSIVAAALLCMLVLAVSCRDSKGQKDDLDAYRTKPEMEVGANDTAAVVGLAQEFLEHLKSGETSEAVSMLHFLTEDEQITELPEALAAEQLKALRLFRVYGYSIESLVFFRETDSQLDYRLQVSDAGAKGPTIGGRIRPVRRDGQWYLTLANNQTEYRRSELDNE